MKRFYTRLLVGLIILVTLGSFTNAYFTWAGLASNQTISRDNLLDAISTGVLTAQVGASIPSGSKQVRKDELLSWVYVDPTNATLSGRSSNQLIIKSAVTPKTVYTITLSGTPGIGCNEAILYAVSNQVVASDITITFTWCTDNGAVGTAFTLTILNGTSSVSTSVNTSAYGGSGCVGTDVRIHDNSLSVSTSLSTNGYAVILSSSSWDNGCNFGTPASSGDYCTYGCL